MKLVPWRQMSKRSLVFVGWWWGVTELWQERQHGATWST
jgi:hypothetical protein